MRNTVASANFAMFHRFPRFLVLAMLAFLLAACAAAPKAPAPQHLAAAKRFLHSFGAGDMAMWAFKKQLEVEAKEQPGVAELVQRAFADLKAEDFENMIAVVYARHLSQAHLADLSRFSESKTGRRFFKTAISAGLEGKSQKEVEAAMATFSADELIEIAKFAESEAFTEMTKKLPTINAELAEEGKKFGERTMREYLKRQK